MRLSSKLIKSAKADISPVRHTVLWQRTEKDTHECQTQEPSVDVQNLIAQAQLKADALVRQARGESKNIAEQAYAEGFKNGEVEGFAAGKERAAGLIQEATRVLSTLSAHKKRLIEEAEEEVLKLALEVAAKIIKRQVQAEPDTVNSVVKDALSRIRDEQVTVRLNPVDAVVVQASIDSLLKDTAAKHVELREDHGIQSPGCEVQTRRGNIDLTMETQMREIEAVLRGARGS